VIAPTLRRQALRGTLHGTATVAEQPAQAREQTEDVPYNSRRSPRSASEVWQQGLASGVEDAALAGGLRGR